MTLHTIGQRAKDMAERGLVSMYLQQNKEKLAEKIRVYLKELTVESFAVKVKAGEMPYIGADLLEPVHGYEKFLSLLTLEYCFEILAIARIDLAKEIVRMGPEGKTYMGKFRQYLISLVKSPQKSEEAARKQLEEAPSTMVMVTCTACNHQWQVKKEDVPKIEKCPNCGKGKDDVTEPPAPPPGPAPVESATVESETEDAEKSDLL